MNLQGGILLLQEVMNDLPKSERKVAQFILDNPRHFIGLSITELAEESGTSAAGVVRLCKRLRMSGFRELKLRITMDVSHSFEAHEVQQVGPGASVDDIAKSVVHNSEGVIKDLLKTLDLSNVRRAIDVIASARRTEIYAADSSSVVAQDLDLKLLKLGAVSSFRGDPYQQVVSGAQLRPGDVAIAFSYSGETATIMAALREARQAGAHTISVTRFSRNAIADLCEINLFVPSSEPILESGDVISHTPLLLISDILFAGVATVEPQRFGTALTRTSDCTSRLSS